MIQYAVFDLDGTLAPYDAATDRADIALLKDIENKGVQIVICSGKPVFYSCGFLRQTGLKEPIIIGENGAEIQFGYKLPPSFFYHMPYSEQAKESLHFFYKKIKEAIPDMWFQPNMVELSPFPKSREEFRIIDDIIQNNREHIQDIHIFKYFDCYDFIPMNINKGEALRFLSQKLNIKPDEMISVGDSQNDAGMFAYTGDSISIGMGEKSTAKQDVSTLAKALEIIYNEIKKDEL